jgi:hypothetical protein
MPPPANIVSRFETHVRVDPIKLMRVKLGLNMYSDSGYKCINGRAHIVGNISDVPDRSTVTL